ncbi:DUF4307 domain-containing protein [Demequina rhizosphaerae]|uniref:DUF4307 domain-containing protein n=1 Tax=Demequina rhizosphaerae TaxID=1638985 RepID=UPI000784C3AD|nr:DUF4307 domain-containing protein [Demequina rhizosphaerae]
MSTPESEQDEHSSGALPRLTPRQWILVAAGLAALVGAVAWYALVAAHEPVRWKDVGFSVASATEVTVTYDVYLYDEVDVDCALRALNPRFTEVGVATQRVAYEDGAQQRLTTAITTTEEATTAQVQYCVPVG